MCLKSSRRTTQKDKVGLVVGHVMLLLLYGEKKENNLANVPFL